jgi:hypothetical protein
MKESISLSTSHEEFQPYVVTFDIKKGKNVSTYRIVQVGMSNVYPDQCSFLLEISAVVIRMLC